MGAGSRWYRRLRGVNRVVNQPSLSVRPRAPLGQTPDAGPGDLSLGSPLRNDGLKNFEFGGAITKCALIEASRCYYYLLRIGPKGRRCYVLPLDHG